MIHTPAPTLHREIRVYLEFLDEARKEMPVADIATYEACVARAESIRSRPAMNPRPGRYEGNDDAPLAHMLDVLCGDTSYIDEEFGEADGPSGWIARIGRFIVTVDRYGFFGYHDHESEIAAEAAFATIEAHYEEDAWRT